MSKFVKLDEKLFVSKQIETQDLAQAAEMGIALIINNRPEGESEDQPAGREIETAAKALGIAYCAIPIVPGQFAPEQVESLAQALQNSDGPALAFCRTGTRSTFLWSLMQARAGVAPEDIAKAAMEAGYDVAPIRPHLEAS